MASKQSKEIILKFIREEQGKATKNDVVKYMELDKVPEEGRTSRITTLKLIGELETSEAIVIEKGQRRGQSHRLIFNDRNRYNTLSDDINQLRCYVEEMSHIVNREIAGKGTKNGLTSKHFRDLVYLQQDFFYTKISFLAHDIDRNIFSLEDRETLHLRLAQTLILASLLNGAMLYTLKKAWQSMVTEIHRLETLKHKRSLSSIDKVIDCAQRYLIVR